ncbi:MAG: hypothetical protein DYG89_14385 [Caldilinea sp. CFX5]|nr:hypothetical protein [Caldilinea sp. CFX5]
MVTTLSATATHLLSSLPAFAAALRTMTPAHFARCTLGETPNELAPMYRVNGGNRSGSEVDAAAHVLSEVVDRIRRLNAAYGEWAHFDAPAYFDLSVAQAACLLRVSERVTTVHITFYADLLLPSFQQLLVYWSETFVPAYDLRNQDVGTYQRFVNTVQPTLVAHWQQALSVITQTRRLLLADVSFLAINGGQEERARWRQWWDQPSASGLDPHLTPALNQLPTLTLSLDFPLPAHRQPHRLRRLRRSRERRRMERRRQL